MINIGNIVTKQANLKANKLAVYDQPNDKRVSFSELNNMVNKIANTLLELGVCKVTGSPFYRKTALNILHYFLLAPKPAPFCRHLIGG